MNSKERLAVLTALQKAVKLAIADARADVDGELLELSEAHGVKSIALEIDGQNVGQISVVGGRPRQSVATYVNDTSAAVDFLCTNGHFLRFVFNQDHELLQKIASAVYECAGVQVDGVECVEVTAPARKTTRVTVNHGAVAELVRNNGLKAADLLELPDNG